MKLGFVVAILVLPSIAFAEPSIAFVRIVSGQANVKDGDDIIVSGIDVRLQGVAAPEWNSKNREVGGKEALTALSRIAEGKDVVCYLDGTQTRGREVGVCELDGQDVGALLIREGAARDCPRYSKSRYAGLEDAAAKEGASIRSIYSLPSYCNG